MFLSWSSIETETGEKKSMGAGTRRSEEVGFVCLWKVVCSVCLVGSFELWPETNLCDVKTQRHPGHSTHTFFFLFVLIVYIKPHRYVSRWTVALACSRRLFLQRRKRKRSAASPFQQTCGGSAFGSFGSYSGSRSPSVVGHW